MPYEQRVQWVRLLRENGVSVTFDNGPVFDEARHLYNRGRIGLNWSSMQDLNCRAFELPAMKLYPVMNFVPDLHHFEFSKSCGIFNNMGEAVEQVLWAKNNPEKAQEYADIAYKYVLPHTYDSRVEQLLKECRYV